jgi:thiosulfate reductase cytochrome b subunit
MAPRKTNNKVELAIIANDIKHIRLEVDNIKNRLDDKYVTKTEFDPVKKVVYGIISLILVAVVGGLLGLIILR